MRLSRLALPLSALLVACGDPAVVDGTERPRNDTATPNDLDVALSPADELFAGVPDEADLPAAGKQDATYPSTYFALVAKQSPVRNQRSRGVCSIFAATALMEHLYITEGSLPDPDFSEQYLQWSVKENVKSFPNTSGSNAQYNLRAINEFGVPEEGAWPYEPRQWSATNDPACTSSGDGLPTRCYTNGAPPDAAKTAPKFFLPPGRWINAKAYSIKGHMTSKKTSVVIGVKFFYQSWNHGSSKLKVNNEYFREGYVLYPNDDDKKQEPAGHAVLLVGWDDTLEVTRLDKDGNPMKDASGKELKEKGFYIFKNSWGTGSFGVNNRHGDGYGYISQKYVAEYGTAYVSAAPVIAPPTEQCDNGVDDDRDGKVDCLDTECARNAACTAAPSSTYQNSVSVSIPDNNMTGVSSEIDVPVTGSVSKVTLTVDITHTYSGDVSIFLSKGTKKVTVVEADGSETPNIKKTFVVTGFSGTEAKGKWKLTVRDEARGDTGRLNSWKLAIER